MSTGDPVCPYCGSMTGCNCAELILRAALPTSRGYGVSTLGWECPKCGRINAPSVLVCPCGVPHDTCRIEYGPDSSTEAAP